MTDPWEAEELDARSVMALPPVPGENVHILSFFSILMPRHAISNVPAGTSGSQRSIKVLHHRQNPPELLTSSANCFNSPPSMDSFSSRLPASFSKADIRFMIHGGQGHYQIDPASGLELPEFRRFPALFRQAAIM
jgi:hypothetical protein